MTTINPEIWGKYFEGSQSEAALEDEDLNLIVFILNGIESALEAYLRSNEKREVEKWVLPPPIRSPKFFDSQIEANNYLAAISTPRRVMKNRYVLQDNYQGTYTFNVHCNLRSRLLEVSKRFGLKEIFFGLLFHVLHEDNCSCKRTRLPRTCDKCFLTIEYGRSNFKLGWGTEQFGSNYLGEEYRFYMSLYLSGETTEDLIECLTDRIKTETSFQSLPKKY
jgi:hypothetical protein